MRLRQRLLGLITPSPRVRKLLWVFGGILGMVVCCFGVMFLSSPPKMAGSELSAVELFVFILTMFVLPAAVLMLIVAALFEKRDPPRAALWLASGVAVGLGSLLFSAWMAFWSPLDISTILVFLLTGIAPVFLVISLPAVYFTSRALPELRAALETDLVERTLGLINAHGAVSFDHLAAFAGVPISEVDNLLDGLLRSGRLAGTMDVPRRMVFTTATLARKQHLLLDEIRSRGRVHLDHLARTLNAPRGLLIDWIYQLVQRGQFDGYINWREGWLYSALAGRIGAKSQCPQCGGQLSTGPRYTIVCLYCGTQVLSNPDQSIL